MKALVTGAAGFVGSHFCELLLKEGYEVLGLDNFSTGQRAFLKTALNSSQFQILEMDLLDLKKTVSILCEYRSDIVIHLAANADIRFGLLDPSKDFNLGTVATFHILEACRLAKVQRFVFASTSSVYGDAQLIPTPEDCPFPTQTSLYAASKVAGEALVQAYSEGYGIQSNIFRFVSLLGPRYSHGHIFDFVKKLLQQPTQIDVLGNGLQKKSYLHIADCVAGMWNILNKEKEKVGIYNIGSDECLTVKESLDIVCSILNVRPEKIFSQESRGWIGDSPTVFLDCKKIQSHGWKPQIAIHTAVSQTVEYLLENRWLLEARL